MVTVAKPAHNLNIGKYKVCQSVSLCWLFHHPCQEFTNPVLQEPPRSLVLCCVVASRYQGGWRPLWGPGLANMRHLPAGCSRVRLLFLVRLAVAGTLLKNTHIITPADLNLQVLSCPIIPARAELCAPLLPSDRTLSIPLDGSSWTASVHPWKCSSGCSGSAQILCLCEHKHAVKQLSHSQG